ncbi:cytochrome P450 [Periconia macrospinosa]|uniref:Cytochrome P450 n=1 Tax=Periconia macrospinosa TaxID=97972 RepID=A0A2V1E904_9PLEO|nr:cytochrome P450 [Periconia macrospinosa]
MALVTLLSLCALCTAGLWLVRTLYIGLFSSPLSSIPGPWYSRFTHLVLRFYTLTGRRIHYVHYLHCRYGGIVRIAPDEVAISDLDGFAKIHKIGSGFLKSKFYDTLVGSSGNREPGIFAQRDPHLHAARRRLFAQAFSNSALQRNWSSEIHQKAHTAVARIKADALAGEADILKWWTLMATDVIAHLAFGESFNMLELGKQTPYIDAIQSALLGGVLRSELPWLYNAGRWLPVKTLETLTTADNVVFEHGALAVRNMKDQNHNSKNLFGQMVAAAEDPDKDKPVIKDSSVQLEAGNLIVAGSDTTAVTLTYLVWAVLNDTALQRDIEEEVAGLSSDIGQEELKDAPLLNSVIAEALRLYGAAPGALPRIVPAGGADIGGHFLPQGIVVSTQAYTMHRDPSIFPNPYQFDGRRFLSSELTRSQKTAYSPFGGGSRICIGLHLAWMELRLGAALFFRECRGARISTTMTVEMMDTVNHFLIAPKGHCCNIVLDQ